MPVGGSGWARHDAGGPALIGRWRRPRPSRPSAPVVIAWTVLGVLVLLSALMFVGTGLPSPALFGALLGAVVYAVGFTQRSMPGREAVWPALAMPSWSSTVGQAIIGVSIGALVEPSTLQELTGDGVPILAAGVVTLALSIASGWALARGARLSQATGVFAMIAGGASGITAIARELGADDRVVSVVQYVRVLLILVGMPIVATLVFHPPSTGAVLAGSSGSGSVGVEPWWTSLLYVAVCGAVGAQLGRWLHIPAGVLLGPLAVAMLIGVFVEPRLDVGFGVPAWLMTCAFVLVGAQVGIRFTPAAIRSIARLLPLALGLIVAVIALSAGTGVLLARWTGQSALDGYLATTPGGLYAVLAVAVDSGSDVTFVLTTQVIRLILMLAAAPILARMLRVR